MDDYSKFEYDEFKSELESSVSPTIFNKKEMKIFCTIKIVL